MEKINIYLQYPWKFPDSSYYKNILEYPPKNVEFVNYFKGDKDKKIEIISSSKKFEYMRKFKNLIRQILRVLKIPNITYTFRKDIDLIHCAHCLSLNKNKPWIVDTEVYDRIAATGNIAYSRFGKSIIRRFLENDYCKKIICWTEDCEKTFIEAFSDNKKILDKIEIVHFALPIPKFKKTKSNKIRLLFVARWFEAKGGKQVLYVFDKLTRKYKNVEAIFICPIPKEFKEKYKENKKIKILDLMPQEKLFKKIYLTSDIFVYPGFGDSYGFAVPEALAFGLPIVTVDSFARKELIKNGKTGFIVPRPKIFLGYDCMDKKMLDNLIEKTSKLIENKKLRNNMSKNALNRVKKFHSIKERNKKLRKIYEETLQ